MRPHSLPSAAQLATNKPHGTRVKYLGGCRCDRCRAANAAYQKQRNAANRRGEGNPLVSATAARQHIHALSAKGIGRRTVMDLTGLNSATVFYIKIGKKKRIRRRSAEKILAIKAEDVLTEGTLVPAGPTWEKLNALLKDGFTKAELAHRLGYEVPALQIRTNRVTGKTAMRVERLYDQIMEEEPEVPIPNIRNRGSQVVRQWRMLKHLQEHRYCTVEQLAAEFNVSEKTARRDIGMLKVAGVDLRFVRHDDGVILRLDRAWFTLGPVADRVCRKCNGPLDDADHEVEDEESYVATEAEEEYATASAV